MRVTATQARVGQGRRRTAFYARKFSEASSSRAASGSSPTRSGGRWPNSRRFCASREEAVDMQTAHDSGPRSRPTGRPTASTSPDPPTCPERPAQLYIACWSRIAESTPKALDGTRSFSCAKGRGTGQPGLARHADPKCQPHRRHDGYEVTRSGTADVVLPDTSRCHFTAVRPANDPFGAFVPLSDHFAEGDANDYVGKGLSGGGSCAGRIAIRPRDEACMRAACLVLWMGFGSIRFDK